MSQQRCGKRRYRTESEAQQVLVAIRAANVLRKIRENRTKRESRVYPCPKCKGWHITSKRGK